MKLEIILDGWETVAHLGSGSFGSVYEIRRSEFGHEYRSALKVIHVPKNAEELSLVLEDYLEEREAEAYFKEIVQDVVGECAMMYELSGHSNIVSYEEHRVIAHKGTIGWDILIRMELLTSLAKHFKEQTPSEAEIIRMGIDICRALEVCQKEKIIHRDIKPANIFVNKYGDYKLGDFGIARTMGQTSISLSMKGTPDYAAPEIFRGERYNNTVDTYSLGLVLYRYLNAERMPFLPLPPERINKNTREKAYESRMSGKSIPAPYFGSEQLKTVLSKAVAFDPNQRYQTATEFKKALQECLPMAGKEPLVYNAQRVEKVEIKIQSSDEIIPEYYPISQGSSSGNQSFSEPTQKEKKLADALDVTEILTIDPMEKRAGKKPSILEEEVRIDTRKERESEGGRSPEKKRKRAKKIGGIVAGALILCCVVGVGSFLSNSPIESDSSKMSQSSSVDEMLAQAGGDIEMENLFYEISNGEVTITDCNQSASGTLEIPQKIEGLPVTGIGDYAFGGCSSLTSITIPNSVTNIGVHAFLSCRSLTNITIPNGVTSIGAGAFWNCSGLTNITIPNSVTSIGDDAFYHCDSLTNITIPNGVTSIGAWTFSYCSNLTSITIPDSVTSIGDNAFCFCDSLTSITIPDGVTNIGDDAFDWCTSLTSVTVPDSVISIGDGAFSDCRSLTSITLPDGVTGIGDLTFYGCDSLNSITLPDGVTSIGDRAFGSCSSLSGIIIPDSVTSIGENAFCFCDSLTSITIPNSVTSIGEETFWYCSNLASITIPDSVTYIGSDAFSDCTQLAEVYYGGDETQWNQIRSESGNECLYEANVNFQAK